jgi:hypothetical protein
MNTNHLAQLYDQLKPRERLPLIIAAGARGDTNEQRRLSASSPKQKFTIPDYYPLARAMREAVHYHLLSLLDLAATFWQWWGLWMNYEQPNGADGGVKKRRRRRTDADILKEWQAGGIVRYYATRLVAQVDGWKQFCAELKIEPEVQLHFMIGLDNVTRTEAQARRLAFDPEEADRFVLTETFPVAGDASLARSPVPVETVEEVVQSWHATLDQLVRREGGA